VLYLLVAIIAVLIFIVFITLRELKKTKRELRSELDISNREIKEILKELHLNTETRFNSFSQSHNDSVTGLSKTVSNSFVDISKSVTDSLDTQMKNTNDINVTILENLTRLSSTQESFKELGDEIKSFKSILSNDRKRGRFGEVQLESILESLFGENRELFEKQVKLSNSMRADIVIKMPSGQKMAIDSKFPFENYEKLQNEYSEEIEKQFKRNIQQHIDDISKKYIIKSETTDFAMMFIPAESIFIELISNYPNLARYALSKKVIIASPLTITHLLNSVQIATRDLKIHQNASVIQKHIMGLNDEFKRFDERIDKVSRGLNASINDIERLKITFNKMNREFEKILQIKLDD
jgi:DNA recombination protein RmuC